MTPLIQRQIEMRAPKITALAKKHWDLKGKPLHEFYRALRAAEPGIDFLTAAETYRRIHAPN